MNNINKEYGLRNTATGLALSSLIALLAACGGGGGSSSSAPAPTPVSLTNGQAATVVVGQPDFTTNTPANGAAGIALPYGGVYAVSGGALYVPDYGNRRVLVFNSIPVANGASANYALGQPDLTTYTGGATATTMKGPQTLMISGGKMFLTDFSNNRIAIYNSVPSGSPGTVDVVVGQADKISAVRACTATGLNLPETVWVAGGKMVVADGGNSRVLIWNSIPATDGVAADLVLGQADMTTCTENRGAATPAADTIDTAAGAWTDGTRLVVLDQFNSRVLIWNTFPTSNGQAADLVLGQTSFTTAAGGVTATTMDRPYEGVFVTDAGQLFVADSSNNRVLVWNSFPTSNGQAADVVLGQPDFTTNTTGVVTATTLAYPVGIYVSGTQVFVTDRGNYRILIY